jgi:hypothetical protein
VDVEEVEPTTNASQRAWRHAVIWRKLSFGTPSAAGSRFVETPAAGFGIVRHRFTGSSLLVSIF